MGSTIVLAEQIVDDLVNVGLARLVDFEGDLLREEEPGRRPPGPEVVAWQAAAAPAGFRRWYWTARAADGAILGVARLEASERENLHLGDVSVRVRPAYRRRGIGRSLLGLAAVRARAEGRQAVTGATSERVPAGEALAVRIGATPELVERATELELARVDRELLRSWVQAGERLQGRYELWFVVGPYPPEAYGAVAAIQNVMNTAPRGERDDVGFSAARVAENEARLFPGERWTLFARERATGKLAGYTRVWFHKDSPGHVEQGDTAVDPEHRNQGLGRWLKAAMICRILSDRRDAQTIRTGTASTNAAMLSINDALEFRPVDAVTFWRVSTDKLIEVLAPGPWQTGNSGT